MELRRIKKKSFIFLLSAIIIGCFLTSCSDSVPMKIEIDSVGWDFRNYDPAYEDLIWNHNNGGGCYINFKLYYYGDALQSGDIVSYIAESDDGVFDVPVEEDILFDASSDENKHYIDGYYLWRGDDHILSLGPWTFTITFRDGSESVKKMTFPKPGSIEVQDYTYITNENATNTGAAYFQMIKRADIESAVYTDGTGEITVRFSINDSQTRSGRVMLYDENGDYIIWTDLFVDSYGIVDSNFDNGFNTDGNVNIYRASLSDYPDIEIDINSTYYTVILLYDGKQYDDTKPEDELWYDCQSRSAPEQISF